MKTKKITTRGLRKALMNGNIIPWYQPVVSAQGEVAGVEVLARWICKDGTHISPEVFIPAAILSGDIALVTQVLMKRAAVDLAQIAEWLPHPFHVAFNIPATVLSGQHFLTDCRNFQAAFSPGTIQIMIEVTERDTAEDLFRVAERLNQLILDGVNVVLDDFGTGYANLNLLCKLPLTMIKIDRSFCVGSPGSAEWKTASAVTLLAQRLGKYVLAEGVETAAQVGRMMSLGVNYFQGYYFSPPVPVGQLIWRILPGAMAFSKRTLQ